MEATFHKSRRLSKEKMRVLIERKNHPALLRFSLMYLLFILAHISAVWAWGQGWYYLIPAWIICAVMTCSVFASLHETAHGTAFKSRNLNKITAFMVGLAHIYPSTLFKELHLTHHRYTHEPGKDPEISLGGQPAPSVISNMGMYLFWLTGLPLLLFKISMIISGALGMPEILRKHFFVFVNPKRRWVIFRECWANLLVYGSLIFLFASTLEGGFAVIIGQVLGHALLAFYLAMEHNGLPHDGDILEKTRSIPTNRLVKLVMWNMPYHAEHHAYPAVPFHALPDLHQALSPDLKHKETGHCGFHFSVISRFFTKTNNT
jgi:fatty acid desaturase